MKRRGLVNKLEEAIQAQESGAPKQLTFKDLERKLYEMPDHLKPNVKLFKEDPSGALVVNNVLSGITEVQLPNEFKQQNIEDTQKAKQAKKAEKKEQHQQIKQLQKLMQVPDAPSEQAELGEDQHVQQEEELEIGADKQNVNNAANDVVAVKKDAADEKKNFKNLIPVNYNSNYLSHGASSSASRNSGAQRAGAAPDQKLKIVEEIIEEDGKPVEQDEEAADDKKDDKKHHHKHKKRPDHISGEKRPRSHDQMLYDKYKKKFQRY